MGTSEFEDLVRYWAGTTLDEYDTVAVSATEIVFGKETFMVAVSRGPNKPQFAMVTVGDPVENNHFERGRCRWEHLADTIEHLVRAETVTRESRGAGFSWTLFAKTVRKRILAHNPHASWTRVYADFTPPAL